MAFKIANLAAILATFVALASASETTSLRRLSWNHTKTIAHQRSGAYVEGAETLYDDFSLAWRFLGFYTDCNVCVDGGDDDDADYDEELMDPSECAENGQDTVCRRYALWAAYVDEGYEGNGKNEYQHYDRKHKRWDDSICGENGSRCVKMDCHDPYSKNFKLVGVYKDSKIDTMLENMIGYSGDCVWNDDDYKFMQAMNYNNNNKYSTDYWPPKSCTAIQKNNNGAVRGYYDAKPMSGGKLEMSLYSDNTCATPFKEKDHVNYKLEHMIGRSSSDIEKWNEAMDAFKICQPCVSYDTFFVSNKHHNKKNRYNANGDRYGYQNQGDDDAANGDEPFVCKTNLEQDNPTNQCQVLLEGGDDTMTVASYRDILLAESQGTVTGIDLSPSSDKHRGKMVMGEPFVRSSHKWLSILLLLFSITYFFISLSNLFEMDRSKNSKNKSLSESLVGTSNRSRRSKSPKRVVTAIAAQKEQKKAQKKQQKKSILKQSNNDDDDSQESAPYSIL